MSDARWSRRPLLFGVVHLPPLPGAPRAERTGRAWRERALSDARAYAEAGFDGVLVENYGDAPFFKDRVPVATSAALAVAAAAVRDSLAPEVLVGVNVLRNDAPAAVAIAAAAGLDCLRVNVLAGATMTDQGLVEGEAATVLRDRARLAPDVRILADVRVKHGAPLAERPLAEEARDLVARAGADGIIVTGPRTGSAADRAELEAVRDAVPDALRLVGSGADTDSVRGLLALADGVLVGTATKQGGVAGAPVDPGRARAFTDAARA